MINGTVVVVMVEVEVTTASVEVEVLGVLVLTVVVATVAAPPPLPYPNAPGDAEPPERLPELQALPVGVRVAVPVPVITTVATLELQLFVIVAVPEVVKSVDAELIVELLVPAVTVITALVAFVTKLSAEELAITVNVVAGEAMLMVVLTGKFTFAASADNAGKPNKPRSRENVTI